MAPRGIANNQWKGSLVSYKSLHAYMNRNFPRVGRCERCQRVDRPTEYASIGHVYTRNRSDWLELCRLCHRAMDGSYERTPEIRAKTGERSKGRTLSPESRAKISAAKRGRKLGPQSAAQRARTAETKRAWWAAKKAAEVESRAHSSQTAVESTAAGLPWRRSAF